MFLFELLEIEKLTQDLTFDFFHWLRNVSLDSLPRRSLALVLPSFGFPVISVRRERGYDLEKLIFVGDRYKDVGFFVEARKTGDGAVRLLRVDVHAVETFRLRSYEVE